MDVTRGPGYPTFRKGTEVTKVTSRFFYNCMCLMAGAFLVVLFPLVTVAGISQSGISTSVSPSSFLSHSIPATFLASEGTLVSELGPWLLEEWRPNDKIPATVARLDRLFSLVKQEAKTGDLTAQVILAAYFLDGRIVKENPEKGLELLRAAALKKHSVAEALMGVLYGAGLHVAHDPSQAERWFLRYAEPGDPKAWLNLGYLYAKGQLIVVNEKKAVNWFHRAAENGNAEAQYLLCLAAADGWGMAQDYDVAFEWCQRASTQKVSVALNQIGNFYAYGQGVSQDFGQAIEWYRKAIILENTNAMANLAIRYYYGEGVVQDYSEAKRWLEKAADLGHAGAFRELGLMALNGVAQPRNLAQAVHWLTKAAETGDVKGQAACPRSAACSISPCDGSGYLSIWD